MTKKTQFKRSNDKRVAEKNEADEEEVLDENEVKTVTDDANDDNASISNEDGAVKQNNVADTASKTKGSDSSQKPIKPDVGIDPGVVPVNVNAAELTFENAWFDKKVSKYAKSIRLEYYKDADVEKPFDDEDAKGLEDSRSMLEVLDRIPIVIALICLKVREEGLWRNQGYRSHMECLCEWLNLKEGAVNNYLTAGLVITMIIKERGISGLPTALAPYLKLAKLKFENIILDAYDKAKAKADKGDSVITEKIVVDAMSAYKTIASSTAGKTRKTAEKAKTEESENSSASEPETSKWGIGNTSKGIVKHVETVLEPAIEDYLSRESITPKRIEQIADSLRATLKLLEKALRRKSTEE